PGVPVALKVTLGPPVSAAVSVFAPAVVPRRQLTLAVPVGSVTTTTLAAKAPPVLPAPPPVAAVKVTLTPVTGLLFASRTTTVGGGGTAGFPAAARLHP